MLALFPAPPFQNLGPIHMYGLCIALGVYVAYLVAERRWRNRGHDPADITALVIPVVISGVFGARVYHLFTGYDWAKNGIAGTVAIWNGGLSIWGAVIFGGVAAVIVAWRRHLPIVELLDCLSIAVVLAQAIGRWGNYFNQELFGRPTSLPWGLVVDPAFRPPQFATDRTFHPTFLYESLWCVGIFLVLNWAEKHFGDRWRVGWTVCGYAALYTLGRSYFEWLRIDKARTAVGTSFNFWFSVALCFAALATIVVIGLRGRRYPGPPAAPLAAVAPPEDSA
ncbi:MAG: prolipoprotein diacylglyceryl transferase [Acidimicrobiia bacterium]